MFSWQCKECIPERHKAELLSKYQDLFCLVKRVQKTQSFSCQESESVLKSFTRTLLQIKPEKRNIKVLKNVPGEILVLYDLKKNVS